MAQDQCTAGDVSTGCEQVDGAQHAAEHAHDAALLRALQSKYQTLHALRLQDTPEAVPRARFAALAAAFPGALRELDRVPLSLIEQRLSSIEAVLAGRARLQQWMRLQLAYHGFMRAVLRIRRSLLAAESHDHAADPLTQLSALAYVPAPDEPALARFDAVALATLRKPPRGRLNPWVLAQVAQDHGVSVQVVEAAFFSPDSGAQ
ncbi:MAG: hypothetical protein ABW321_27635 [Polyangiales bacterium]